MFKVIETQYLPTGRASSMAEVGTLKEAMELFHYKMYYAYNQHFNSRVQVIGENGEYIENRLAEGAEQVNE